VKRWLILVVAALICVAGCGAQQKQEAPAASTPVAETVVHDVCWYEWGDGNPRYLETCRVAHRGKCATIQDKTERYFCNTEARAFAEVRLQEMEHPPDPTQQRIQELEDKISNQQMEIDEARRRASDAESESDAAVGMMLNNRR
jgi:hypothetical protein